MGMLTLEKLKELVENKRVKKLSGYKRKYALARELGFSSAEANVLQFKSENIIRALAGEKNGKTA